MIVRREILKESISQILLLRGTSAFRMYEPSPFFSCSQFLKVFFLGRLSKSTNIVNTQIQEDY